MNELFQIQPQWARARCLRSNPLAIGVEMPDRPIRAERPFTPLLLLLAIGYLMAVLTPTSASAARLDSAEALAAWAKSKNWTKTSYGIGYKSDKINSFDIWIVYDRTPTLIPFKNSSKGSGRDPQAVTETGENITIAGGIPATRLYLSLVRTASGHESEKWEYYCHDYRVLMRAHRDTQIGQAGSDPLALLENYIAFVNKYLNVKPLSIGKTGKEDLHEIKITGGPQGSANPAFPGQQIECIVAAQDSLGHELKYKWTALGAALGFNDPTLKRPTWTVQPNDTENMVYWPIAVEVSCDHGASAKGHYIQKVWPKDNPQLAKFRDSFNARKVKGDVQVDRGEFGMITVKEWDIIRVGDIIVTGANSKVSLTNLEHPGRLYIEQNSRVKIIRKREFLSLSQRWQKNKKVWRVLTNFINEGTRTDEDRSFFCLDEGSYYVADFPANGVIVNFLEFFIEPGRKHIDPEIITYQVPKTKSYLYTSDRDTIYKLTHNKSNGNKSVAVVEGEVMAVCDLQPETVWSVKAGEKLIVDNDCDWQKTKIAASEIQQITSLFPDIKKATRLAPVADSYVYAYSYRNWNKANWGKYGSLGAGWHPTGGEKRTYLKFDLSGIDPKNAGKATLKLFHYHTGGNNSLSLGVYAVTSPWQEGGGTYHSGQTEKTAAPGEISWVNQPTFDFSPVASFKPGSGAGKYIEVDITPLVKAWLSGKPNYGLMIKPAGKMSGRAPESSYGFYSREYKDSQKRPQLFLNTPNEPIDPNDTAPVGGSSGTAQGTARLLTASSNRDMVGPNEKFRGNGKTDAIFRAQFSAPNRTVTAVEVSNTNGLRSVWDTRPNNRLWLGGVVVGGRTMNRPDGSVNFSLGSGQNTLDFFVEDNGSIRGGKTNYRMTIFFASGD
ncbi:MAG: DNRLRE domain-containing protein, partial [Deltaproteobacteria bacterium]|nr:DNRLRE domain-containing protein [Deltaproteobacteria bacterium]